MHAASWFLVVLPVLAWAQTPVATLFERQAYDSIVSYSAGRRVADYSAGDHWRLARSLYYIGRNTGAIETYEQLLSRPLPDSLRNWINLGFAEVLIETAQYDACLPILQIQAHPFLDSVEWRVRALNVRGIYWLRTSQYEEANRCLLSAWNVSTLNDLKKEQSIAATHLGIVKRATGDFEGALQWYGSSRPWIDHIDQPIDRAVLHTNLGITFFELGNHAMALKQFDSALASYKAVDDDAGVGLVLGNRSTLLLEMGDLERAKLDMSLACQLAEQAGDRFGYSQWRMNIAIVELRLGRIENAERLFSELIVELGNLQRPVEAAGAMLGLAECLAKSGKIDSAIVLCDQAGMRLDSLPASSDKWLVNFLSGRFCLEKADTNRALSEWKKALNFIELMREDIEDVSLSEYFFEYDRQKVYRDLAWLLIDCGRVREAFAIYENARARGIKNYGFDVMDTRATTFCYFAGSERLGVFVIQDSTVEFELLGNTLEIRAQVADFISQIRSANETNPTLRKRLSDKLLRPIVYRPGPNSTIRIVPDAFLFYLPFEALDELLLQQPVVYSFCARSLASGASKDDSSFFWIESSDRFDNLPNLPGVRMETTMLRSIANRMGLGVRTGFGPCVRGKILHIATHATHSPGDPDMSGFFSLGPDRISRRITAAEVRQSGARAHLVVLSACETGLGELMSGEGLVGLPRAFIINGSQHVVATLWRINDEATSEFMEKFYSILLDGRAPADALRLAKIGMQNGKWRAPKFWAGFLLWSR